MSARCVKCAVDSCGRQGLESNVDPSGSVGAPPRVQRQHGADKEAKVAVWNNMALLGALFWTAASEGLLSASTARSAVLWCLAFFSLMLSVMGFMSLACVGGHVSCNTQFNDFLRLSGRSYTVPWILFGFGFVGLILNLINELHRIAGMAPTAWCVFFCIGCMMVPLACFQLWQNKTGQQAAASSVGDESEEIYAALEEYFVVYKQASLADVDREEFLQQFSVASRGEFIAELAEVIFDDWKAKKMKYLLRRDLGF